MKLKLQTIITCLLLLISFTAKSQYDATEVAKLQAFFNQTDGVSTNGFKMSAVYNSSDPSTWGGLTWDASSPKKLTSISFPNKSLVGSLDLSGFTTLNNINVSANSIISLDVSGCTALNTLNCDANQMTSLNLSANTALTVLNCYNNNLTSLDLTQNTTLQGLRCYNNPIQSLYVANKPSLVYLYCYNNKLTSLDVSQNSLLQDLRCHINQLTVLDVTNNHNLSVLSCSQNQLTVLDVTSNNALQTLQCDNNKIQSLDVTNAPNLDLLTCTQNQLTSLNLSANTALTSLQCSANQLKFSDTRYSSTVTFNDLTPQRPFIPPVDGINIDTAGGTMAAATGATIDLTKETGINEVLLQTGAPTTFHVWKKAWDGTITDVTGDCGIDVPSAGKITLPASAGEYDSLFITMSNTTYPQFVEQTTTATALSSGMRTRLFRIVGATFLPIELLSFTATLNNNKVDLAWSTASEKNNAFFTVERSVNNKDWENVAKINGAGNSNTQLNYSTIDENPLSGISYYRLKQTDFDGKFEYSKTIVIDRNAKTAIQLYPNPATNQISVTGNEDDLNSIKIYNSLGQDVTKYTNYSASNTKQIMIDISKLTNGIYILKTKNTTNRLIVK